MANLRVWLTEEEYSEFHAEIAAKIHEGAWTELENGFYTALPFGTGGRRGPRGLGPNRVNRRTIAESARGLANWVERTPHSEPQSIVIAFDTRHASPEFSRVCARAIAAAGIQVYLFDEFRPTPELSFAVRCLKASAGIVVSASHNPPADNGFKAYGPDGGQLVPPDDLAVMEEVAKAGASSIPLMDFDEGLRTGIIRIIGKDVDEAYQDALATLMLSHLRDVRLVYTPLHGVGGASMLPALERAGFTDVHVVAEQSFPSGDFPNVENNIPNPEFPGVLAQAKALAMKIDADIGLATDPDADRLGCVAKRVLNGQTDWLPLNGNQIGAVLCYFVLDELQRQGRLSSDALVLKTTVTTDLVTRIAEHFNVAVISDLLVGFKNIACVLNNLDDPERLVFAAEESHGYLRGSYSHDKDAAAAGLLLSEAAAQMKARGRDLWGLLSDIYRRFGYFSEYLENYLRPGKSGQQEIVAMMDGLRARPPRCIAGLDVLQIVDRFTNEVRDAEGSRLGPFEPIKDPMTGQVIQQLTLAKDNLLIFHLAGNDIVDGAKVAIRPSGTEPKCKFYIAANRRVPKSAGDAEFEALKQQVDMQTLRLRDGIVRDILRLET